VWGKVNARKLRGGNEDDQCNFSKILKKYDFSEHRKINGFARKRL
jgi:hypothetical protein